MAKVSKNIKKIRKEQNVTQDALAEKLGVTRQAISNWENDKSQPDIESIKMMAEIFGIEMEELIYGEKRNVGVEADKVKDKTTFRIILSTVGTFFVGIGLAFIFANYWQEFPFAAKGVFAFVPILIGQAMALYVYFKHFNSVVWRESASALWMVGIAATVALVSGVFSINLGVEKCLLIDIILCLPIAYLFNTVAPIAPLSVMTIAWSAELSENRIVMLLLLAAIAFTVFFNRKRTDNARQTYSLWVLAIVPIVAIIFSFGFFDICIILLALFTAYYAFSDSDTSLSVPFKPIGILGTVIMLAILAIDDYSLYYTGYLSANEKTTAIILIIVFAALAAGGLVFDLKKYQFNLYKMIIMGCSLAATLICSVYTLTQMIFEKEPEIDAFFTERYSEDGFILGYLFLALGMAVGVTLIIKGVKELKLLSINLGLFSCLALLIEFMFKIQAEMLLTGVLLLVFGAVLIAVNVKIAGIKKSVKNAPEETGDVE